MAVKTQPHIVAQPIFENTPSIELIGETILHEKGNASQFIGSSASVRGCAQDFRGVRKPLNWVRWRCEEKAAHFLKLGKEGKLDNRRHEFLYREIWKENFFSNGDTKEFLRLIDHPEIVGDKDIYEMDANAKFHIHRKLTGDEFSGTWDYEKTIHHLDLKNYDISELPTKDAVIALKSGCGSGKTENFIKRFVESSGFQSGLYVSVLKGTIEPAARKLDLAIT